MKKLLCALLAIVMIATVFAGCSKPGAQSSDSSKTESSSAQSAGDSSKTDDEKSLVNTDSLYPVVNEPVSMSVAVRTGPDDLEPDEKWFYRWWKNASGVDIEFININADALGERRSVMLASETLPDVMYSFGWSNADMLNYGQKEGFFAVLNDAIDKYGDKINEKLDACPGAREGVTLPDGNIYSIPQMTDFPDTVAFSSQNYSINTTWLQNLGLDKPATLDEFYETLKAFKEKDANGNGDATDEIPWSGLWVSTINRNIILLAYGIVSNGDFGGPALKDGKVTYAPVDDDYINYLTFMRKLYSEGLLDQDVFSQEETALTAKGNEMRVGVLVGGPYYFTGLDNDNYAQYESFTLVSDSSRKPVSYMAYAFNPGFITISSTCEHLDVAVRLVNMLYDDCINIMQFYGPEKGSEYDDDYAKELDFGYENVYDDNGDWYDYTFPGYNEEKDGSLWAYLCRHCMCAAGNAFTGVLARMNYYNADPLANGTPYEEKWRSSNRENILPYIQYGYPVVYLDDASLERINEIATPLSDYALQMEAKFITGAESLDNYDAYLEEMKRLGSDEYIQIYTDAYNNK